MVPLSYPPRRQGECINPELNINGKTGRVQGYITDLLTGHALEFLNKSRTRLFVLYFADGSTSKLETDAEDFIPAPRHRELYKGMIPPRRANYARKPKNKPALEQKIPGLEPLGPKTLIDEESIFNRLRMAKAVDESLGQVLQSLEGTKQLDNTMIIC